MTMNAHGDPPLVTYYTDYPLVDLGDKQRKDAPLRCCEVLAWDRDKYVRVRVGTVEAVIKAGYVYQSWARRASWPPTKIPADPKAWEGLPFQVDKP